MKDREVREQELISHGMVEKIKSLYKNVNNNISDNYFMLIADYFDTISNIDGLNIDIEKLLNILPDRVTDVSECMLGTHYGENEGTSIRMSTENDYQQNKLYFFHELTHALQTISDNKSTFFNGTSGMFLTEGVVQYTAELVYNASNETLENMSKLQSDWIRFYSDREVHSPLTENKLNGNILQMLSLSMGMSLNDMISLGFNENARELLKQKYESFDGHQGKFEEFMDDLEKIFAINYVQTMGYSVYLKHEKPNFPITLWDGSQFLANYDLYEQLIDKTEQNLAYDYFRYNDADYIVGNGNNFYNSFTNLKLKEKFKAGIQNINDFENISELNISSGKSR